MCNNKNSLQSNILSKLCISTLAILFIFSIGCFVKGASKIPEPTNLKYANDYVGVLDESSKNYVVSLGKELEDKTTSEMTVVIIKSLEGADIESYANQLFRSWGVGKKEKDNGILILMSIDDKKWRVEVGRGLEGIITDIYSSRIMETYARPLFKEGNYSQAVKKVYTIFAEDVAKEYNVNLELDKSLKEVPKKETKVNKSIIYFVLGLFAVDLLLNKGRITRFIIEMMFWNSFFGGGPRSGTGGGSSGGSDGFGGGNSGGGGSSGDW